MRSRPGSRGKQCLQPCIAEILRTCSYPSTLILRVEKILEERTDDSQPQHDPSGDNKTSHNGSVESSTTYRLYLGDGDLMIQAVIAPHLHPLIELQETTEGSLIELRSYKVRKARRLNHKGQVIYLAIQDYVCITLSRPTTSEAQEDVLANGGGFLLDQDVDYSPREVPPKELPLVTDSSHLSSRQEPKVFEVSKTSPEVAMRIRQGLLKLSDISNRDRQAEGARPTKRRRIQSEDVSSSQESDGFETIEVDQERVKKRRAALHNLISKSQPTETQQDVDQESESTPTTPPKQSVDEMISNRDAIGVSPRDAHDIEAPPINTQPPPITTIPFHTLHSLLHPPILLPTKNYSVTLFCIISWISPNLVTRPGFPSKRHLKLHDPSITSRQVGVSISVFIDAAEFRPRHGTIALFRGVVMQRYKDEVILNAYPNLRDSEWYEDDEERLEETGWDVGGLRVWWEERKRMRRAMVVEKKEREEIVAKEGN